MTSITVSSTTSTYDELNRQVGTLDPLLRRTTTTYDAVGNVATRRDHLDRVTSIAYDALNRATTVTEAVGTPVARTTVTTFDEVGNVKATKDGLGNRTTYSYDALNRQTEVQDPLGHRVSTTYNAVGNAVTTTDATGKVVTYGYDALHRQVTTTDPLSHTATTVLDALGQPTASIDALGNTQISVIDALGRGAGSVDARGGLVLNALDGSGGGRLLTDPAGNEWRYVYDGAGREVVRYDPAGAATTTAYDAAGRVTQVTDRAGRTKAFSYDNADRLTGEVWKSAAGATVNLVTYGYDANDNRTGAADFNGTVTYAFDELNRTRTYTNVFGQVLTYTYNAEGEVTRREDSLGGVLTSVYDNAGRLTSRQFGGSGQTPVRIDFGYTNRDELSSKTWYTDLAGTAVLATSAYAYNDAGGPTGITNKNAAAATLSYYNYSYDNADRVSTHTWWSQIGTVVYSGTKTYSYDTTSQLTNDSTTPYSYDLNGNRTMSGYQTGVANRMTNDGTFTYTYDAEGNLTQKSKGASLETWYYGWDGGNRLNSVRKTSDGSTNTLWVTYTYDVGDNLVQEDKWKTGVGNATVRHAFDGANHWADLDGSNAVQLRFVFSDGMDEVLTRWVASGGNAGLWAYLTDSLGSVRDLVNSSAQVQDHIDYGGFGGVAEASAATGDYVKFTGRWYDLDTGLQNNRARWYDNASGRWLSEDPLSFAAGDSNLHRYVRNEPVNRSDPTGLVVGSPLPLLPVLGEKLFFVGPPPPLPIRGGKLTRAVIPIPLEAQETAFAARLGNTQQLDEDEIAYLLAGYRRHAVSGRYPGMVNAHALMRQAGRRIKDDLAVDALRTASALARIFAWTTYPRETAKYERKITQLIKDLDANMALRRDQAEDDLRAQDNGVTADLLWKTKAQSPEQNRRIKRILSAYVNAHRNEGGSLALGQLLRTYLDPGVDQEVLEVIVNNPDGFEWAPELVTFAKLIVKKP